MTSLLVVGGVYRERCVSPEWSRTFGSAGRAASAATSLVDAVEVLTPAPPDVADGYRLEASLDPITVRLAPSAPGLSFDYFHGLSVPTIWPSPTTLPPPTVFDAEAPTVLRFGMLEASARVRAEICVYDPQSAFAPEAFHANGSIAGRLAIVGNRREVVALGGSEDALKAARNLLETPAEVVVVKSGSAGAFVVSRTGVEKIPARLTQFVWPIGSGDVFAAAFTVAWAIDEKDPVEAAEFASYAVADYVESMSLPISAKLRDHCSNRAPVAATGGKVYLAGPFFSMSQRWMVEEARRGLFGTRDGGVLPAARDREGRESRGGSRRHRRVEGMHVGLRAARRVGQRYPVRGRVRPRAGSPGLRLRADRVGRGPQDGRRHRLQGLLGLRHRSSPLRVGNMTDALLLSGGMDSVAIAWWKRPGIAITVDYGQKAAAAEIRAAAAVCAKLGIRHVVQSTDLSAIGSGAMSGQPQLPEAPVPEWWPYRNQMLVTLGAMIGIPQGVRNLMIGCLSTDRTHADGRWEFVKAMDGLLAMQEGGMRVAAPAIEMTAVELISVSGVPAEVLSWAHSCHVADYACGMCRGCQKHYETLEALGREPY